MGIQDFLGKGKATDRSTKYEELSKGKTEGEKRKLEMQLLKPEKIPPHLSGLADKNTFSDIAKRTVKVVFPDSESLTLFRKHFKVSDRIEPSLLGIDKLMAVVQLLEDRKITYDDKSKKAS